MTEQEELNTNEVDDFLEGCDLDFRDDALRDDEATSFALFAVALDPTTSSTVDQVAREWKELFS